MTKLSILTRYFAGNIITQGDRQEQFDLNLGTIEAQTYLVLDEAERGERVSREIKAGLVWIDPKYLAAYTSLEQRHFASLLKIYQEGYFEAYGHFLFQLLEKAVNCSFSGFCVTMVNQKGAGYFLGSFENEEIDLGGGYYAYRID